MSMHLKHSAGIPPSARMDRRGPVWGRPVFRGNAQVFVEHQPRNTKGANAGNTRILQKAAYLFLWLFAFAMPWENALRIPGFGTVSRAVGLAAFGVGFDAFVSERDLVRSGAVDAGLAALAERGLIYQGVLEPPKGKRFPGLHRDLMYGKFRAEVAQGIPDVILFADRDSCRGQNEIRIDGRMPERRPHRGHVALDDGHRADDRAAGMHQCGQHRKV